MCEALEVQRETLGNRHPHTLNSIGLLGALLHAKGGDLTAAEPLYREALEARRKTLGNRHPHTLISIGHLGLLLKDKGDLAAAELLCREALEGWRSGLGNRHPYTLCSISDLGVGLLLKAKGKLRLAEKCYGTAWRWMCGVRRSAAGFIGIREHILAPCEN